MIFHEAQIAIRGIGRWDAKTTRYVPINGGSRSRLPVTNRGYEDIPRYYGGVGMNERLTESIRTIDDLYKYLGGGILVTPQTAAYVSRILEQASKWMQDAVVEEE